MHPHQVVLDRDRCVGSGLCAASMPELFEFDDNRVSTPRNGGHVAADLTDLATAAAEICQANAITLKLTGA